MLGAEPAGDDVWELRGTGRGGHDRLGRAARGARPLQGAGTVHHVAWGTTRDEHPAWRERLADAGVRVTPVIDRYYFHSIYFREPSGVLYEIADDGPGFTRDMPVEELGTRVILPPWLEEQRAEVEARLTPAARPAGGLGASRVSGIDGWACLSEPGQDAAGPALLMLHGTGGDEHEMLAFGRSLLPGAPVLAPRGRISEGGTARFFSRTPQDPFRFPDLPERIDELAAFVREAVPAHGLEGRPLVAVGYSNGANAAAEPACCATPACSPAARCCGRCCPAPAPEGLDLTGTRVLLLAGRADTMIPPDRGRGPGRGPAGRGRRRDQEHWAPAGHGLTQGDLDGGRLLAGAA